MQNLITLLPRHMQQSNCSQPRGGGVVVLSVFEECWQWWCALWLMSPFFLLLPYDERGTACLWSCVVVTVQRKMKKQGDINNDNASR